MSGGSNVFLLMLFFTSRFSKNSSFNIPFFTLQLLCTIEDLKEMGIPLGPRKKIAKFVKERVSKQVRVSPGYLFVSKGFVATINLSLDVIRSGCPSISAGE